MRESGATAALARKQQEMARFKELLDNPLINTAITFMEVFPLGLVVTLVSAAVLRRTTPPAGHATATAAAI